MPAVWVLLAILWLEDWMLRPSRWAGGHAVGLAFGLLAAFFLWRAVRAGVRLRRGGLEVVSSLRLRKRFAWADVDHFEVAPHAFLRSTQAAWLVTRDGQRVCATAMTADDRGTRRRERLQQMVDELNERVAREHARSVQTRSPSAAGPVAGP